MPSPASLPTRPPAAALALVLAAAVPFLWGLASLWSPALSGWGSAALGPRFVGPYLQLGFGTLCLCFMSGAVWGLAPRAGGAAALATGLAAIPFLWAFLMTGAGPTSAALNLIAGFAALVLIDWHCARNRLAPGWWPVLRGGLSAVAVLSLLPLVL